MPSSVRGLEQAFFLEEQGADAREVGDDMDAPECRLEEERDELRGAQGQGHTIMGGGPWWWAGGEEEELKRRTKRGCRIAL